MLRQSRYISTAAMEEVAELGHPELDLDHLLVGLLVTGGPSASRLVAAGADLPSLRRAVRLVQEADMQSLGIHVPPPAAAYGAGTGGGAVPWGARAMAVMRSVDHREDDRALLRALLDDEGRRVERVLSAAGVDVDVEGLRTSLASAGTAGAPEVPVEVAAALAAMGPAKWCTSASAVHEVPVSAEVAWDLVGDVRRRPEWDPGVVEVREDGEGLCLVYGRAGKTRPVRVLFQRTGPRSALWRELWDDEHVAAVMYVAVEPAGAGCRLRVETASVLRTRRGRALRPLARWAAGSRVRWISQSIARAAARADA